jgi:hypothetical protein
MHVPQLLGRLNIGHGGCQREQNDFFAGDRADVGMKTHDLGIENVFDDGFQ